MNLEKRTVESSVLKAYYFKELKMLFRTSAFFLSCVVGSLIFPIFMIIPMMTSRGEMFKHINIVDYATNHSGNILIYCFGFIMFVSSAGAIASTAISREGKNAFFMKYIPLDYTTQILAKILVCITINMVNVLVPVITMYIY